MHWIAVVYGHFNQHRCLAGTCAEKLQLFKIVKTNSMMPEDIPIASSKSEVDRRRDSRVSSLTRKDADGQTDSFQLHMVDIWYKKGGQVTKPIIVVKMSCELLHIIQVNLFLIKSLPSWPCLISKLLVAYNLLQCCF